MHTTLIGIDIGTSSAKAVVIDPSGRLLGWAGQEYPILMPRPGWAEQDPGEWLRAAIACVRSAVQKAGVDPSGVAGIGLTGQMHSLVCLDERGEPLRPAILWADQRSGEQVKALTARLGREHLAEWTGNPLAAGFMLASWCWLQENEPQTAARARWLMLPKDYVCYRLTGVMGSEPSYASSTGLFDPHRVQWSAPVLAAVGLRAVGLSAEGHSGNQDAPAFTQSNLDAGQAGGDPNRTDADVLPANAAVCSLPRIFPSASVAGGLLPEMAEQCGLPAGVPVVHGGSDVSCQALAQGIRAPGTVSCTIGTGGQLFAPLQTPRHDPDLRLHLFCHCLPDTWHQEAAILSAGLALRWLRDQVFPGQDYAALAGSAAGVEAGLDGLFFLPYLAGERTPYMDPTLQAAFLGLGLRHGQAHMVRAVMEGVVFALRQGLELMQSLGTPVERLVASGGGTRHPLWLSLQADIFNRPIWVSNAEEATARGAAMLAGLGVGLPIQSPPEDAPPAALPNPERARRYDEAYEKYVSWANRLYVV